MRQLALRHWIVGLRRVHHVARGHLLIHRGGGLLAPVCAAGRLAGVQGLSSPFLGAARLPAALLVLRLVLCNFNVVLGLLPGRFVTFVLHFLRGAFSLCFRLLFGLLLLLLGFLALFGLFFLLLWLLGFLNLVNCYIYFLRVGWLLFLFFLQLGLFLSSRGRGLVFYLDIFQVVVV